MLQLKKKRVFNVEILRLNFFLEIKLSLRPLQNTTFFLLISVFRVWHGLATNALQIVER